jgi:hypothetical protein
MDGALQLAFEPCLILIYLLFRPLFMSSTLTLTLMVYPKRLGL